MIVGIDLGTTNSLISIWHDGQAVLMPNALGDLFTPSVVGLGDSGELLVGRAARDRLITHPERTTAWFKRHMGTGRVVQLNGRSYRPEELSAFVLRALKADAEEFLGQAVHRAVITVPAYFRDAQRKATLVAGELAGLRVERLLNEPTAGALAYGLQQGVDQTTALVFDLGGGTFDVSVLEFFEGVVEVRASAGDGFLGGEDFTEALLRDFLNKTGLKSDELKRDTAIWNRLRKTIDHARCRLSEDEAVQIRFPINESELAAELHREDLALLWEPLLKRLRYPVEQALRDARIRPSELDEIVLIGGATRMSLVRDLVARMFGRFPAFSIPPDEAVALGAAVQGGLLSEDRALRETVLTDVAPYSLGIEVTHRTAAFGSEAGLFDPIIERNTVIPASRSGFYSTVQDGQRHIDIKVYQGESRFVRDNTFLGKISVRVPPGPAGSETIEVRFTYDPSGILDIDARVLSTGVPYRRTIQENPGVLGPEEVEKRLKALSHLKVHPRDQAQNAATLARANRMFEESLGERRREIGDLLAHFQTCLQAQDPELIESARNEMDVRLTDLEEEPYF